MRALYNDLLSVQKSMEIEERLALVFTNFFMPFLKIQARVYSNFASLFSVMKTKPSALS